MTRRLLAFASVFGMAVGLCGFVPPKLHAEPEIVGVYKNLGAHPDGTPYEGVATIKRLGGPRYEITFEVTNGVFRAICVRDHELLGCGWGSSGLGVGFYRVGVTGLVGTWFRDGDTGVGTERIFGASPESILGEADQAYDLAGTRPDGATYDGRFVSTAISANGSAQIRRVSWRRDGSTIWGWGIATGDAFVTGFPSASCGAALYRIAEGGHSLSAIWMDFSRPDLGLATETLVR